MTYMKVAPQRNGFTLIELSMVLVVIGLIIGGVLVGQDLIRAAETRAQLTQIEKYNSAVNTFRTKYNGLPGDLDLADANTFGFFSPFNCNGTQGNRDGDGLIEANQAPAQRQQGVGEVTLFWSDLSTAGFADGQFSSTNVYCAGAVPTLFTSQLPSYFPTAKIGGGNFLYVYSINGLNWFGLSATTGIGGCCGAMSSNANITVSQAYNMDKKVDDALPTTGKVQAVYLNDTYSTNSPVNAQSSDSATSCYNTTTNTYSTDISNGSNPNCALSFEMQGAAR
jgi:prepilin-type N-terminal cleavage/methylation domain-containing protein